MIVNGREARILSQLTKSTRFRNHTTSGGTYRLQYYEVRLQAPGGMSKEVATGQDQLQAEFPALERNRAGRCR